jgi:hypothetical protein
LTGSRHELKHPLPQIQAVPWLDAHFAIEVSRGFWIAVSWVKHELNLIARFTERVVKFKCLARGIFGVPKAFDD